ncbi:MAG: copper homeostasis protein CutC [Bacteroidales bacterium]|jgi:copper homeostasis protein|nr:copper homeostasis protein CutC [Bacteroidales bacterium]
MWLEICANSVQSAINAANGGAQRIELCQNLNEGGTTPSYATIKYCCEQLPLKTFVLIRPRSGNFLYSDLEYELVKEEVKICKSLNVHGVVIGFLTADLSVDCKRTSEIVNLAYPMEVTFHRAFDICKDWQTALDHIIDCGCHRILTSGQAVTAELGIDLLTQLQQKAQNRIIIMAGCGINSTNIRKIVEATQIKEFHSSASKTIDSSFVNLIDHSFEAYRETDLEEVKKMILQ